VAARRCQRTAVPRHRSPAITLRGDLARPGAHVRRDCLGQRRPHGHGLGGFPTVPIRERGWPPRSCLGRTDPGRLEQVIYFSTVSILDGDLNLLARKRRPTAPNTSRPRPSVPASNPRPIRLAERIVGGCFQHSCSVTRCNRASSPAAPATSPPAQRGGALVVAARCSLRAEASLPLHPKPKTIRPGLRESDPAAATNPTSEQGTRALRAWCFAQPAVSVDDTVSRLAAGAGCSRPRFGRQLRGWFDRTSDQGACRSR